MKWTSILAIYVLFWTLALFLVLPFGGRPPAGGGPKGRAPPAESAPHRFNLGRVALRASLVAAVLTALYVANYVFGWIRVEDLDWLNR